MVRRRTARTPLIQKSNRRGIAGSALPYAFSPVPVPRMWRSPEIKERIAIKATVGIFDSSRLAIPTLHGQLFVLKALITLASIVLKWGRAGSSLRVVHIK